MCLILSQPSLRNKYLLFLGTDFMPTWIHAFPQALALLGLTGDIEPYHTLQPERSVVGIPRTLSAFGVFWNQYK